MPDFPLTGDECFVMLCRDLHGVDITLEEVQCLHAFGAELRQASARQGYALARSGEITSLTDFRVDNGKNFGKILGTAIAVGTAIASGNWWAAGLALLSGVVSLLEKEPQAKQEERFDEKTGFEEGGQLAPSGGVLPRIYCNRNINPSGGVRVGGILVHSRIEVRRGAMLLYQMFILSAGESETLGWGQMGLVDGQKSLFNRQPRANFSDREIATFTRLGTQNQTPIAQFPYYSQNISPPDYKVFGVDRRAKVQSLATVTNPNPNTTNATVTGNTVTKDSSAGVGWNSGWFGTSGLTGVDGAFSFYAPIAPTEAGVGLSVIDQDQNVSSIQHGFHFLPNGTTVVLENGVPKTTPFPTGGQMLLVAGATGVKYFQNAVLVYQGSVAPGFPLYPDVALYSANASVTGLATSSGGGFGVAGLGSTIVPTPNQSGNQNDQNVLDLFNASQDYTIAISGETTRDPKFVVVDKDTPSSSFTTNPAVSAQQGNSIYAYWWARYETTKRVDRIDINMSFNLSARHKGGSSDENNGKLVTHASMFDLYLRPVTQTIGAETFIMRFLVKNRGTQRIFRAIRIMNLKLGRYYFELRPLTFVPYDIARPIYELNDNGYNTDDSTDLEDLPTVATGVFMAGSEVKIQSEMDLVSNGSGGSLSGFWGNPAIVQMAPTTGAVTQAPALAQSPTPATPGVVHVVTIDSSFAEDPSPAFYGFNTAGGVNLTGFLVKRNGFGLDVIRVQNGVNSAVTTYNSYPVTLGYAIQGSNADLNANGVLTSTPITPLQPLHSAVSFPTIGDYPLPTGNGSSSQNFVYSVPQIDEWVSYEKKTQISSESAPTGTITSINEIVHASSIGRPVEAYKGMAVQAYRFRASERLQGAPGTRALVELGTVCPNWMAAGRAIAGSNGNYLAVNDSNFVQLGVQVGWKVRNLDKKKTGTIQTIAANTITTDIDMGWTGGGYCGDRYAVYFLGATCYYPDVWADMIANDFGGIPDFIDPDESIDYRSVVESRAFCVANKYFFDDVVDQRMPFAEWVLANARLSYLFPFQVDGRYGLVPDRQRPIDAVFNATNSRNFQLEFPDWQPNITNTVILRYVDGREIFDQSGTRHRTVTITIRTTAVANGTEQEIVEEVEARSVKNVEQAISVGCLYLKTLRQNTIGLTFETSYQAAYTQAGDIISVQAPSLGIGCEYSGTVMESRTDGTAWLLRLDCQPIVRSGYNPGESATGVTGIDNSANTIAPGFLLRNADTGQSAIITSADADSIDAPVNIPQGDEYEVLSAVQTGYSLSITYRETGATETVTTATTQFIDGVAWLRVTGLTQPPIELDAVNIHPTTQQYRVLNLSASGRDLFNLNCVSHDADIYSRSGLVIEYDDTVLTG